VPPRTRHPAIGTRAWTVAQELRARRGWLLDAASFQRSWAVHGAAAFEVSAHVSLFFHSQCMVVSLTWKPSKARAALESLHASLGERYRSDPTRTSLVVSVRTDRPARLLAEIAHVEQVLGAGAVRRFGPSPRSQDRRRWHVVDALRAGAWRIGSLTFSRSIGDEHRHLGASIGVLVDSASGRPGLNANVAGWVPRTSKRWRQFRDDTAVGLTAEGFRINEQSACFFHAGRWIAGLDSARALHQVDAFDHLLATGADVVR
jgi:hypothetical protein